MKHDRAIFLGTVILVAILTAVSPKQKAAATAEFQSNGETVAELQLEVADTEEERRRGLMDRRSLETGRGMLFVFPGERERTFWMKNTYIPLDIIFIDSEGQIVDIQQADPQPNASEEELKRYRSGAPAKYVIETNRGWAEENGIERGSKVNLTQNLKGR